jgi:hypothetical protein
LNFKMHKVFLLLFLLTLALAQQGSLQLSPLTATLFTSSSYRLSYYTVHPMPSTAQFLMDFSQTYIEIPNATLNASATVQNAAVVGATAVCASGKCTIQLNNAVGIYNNLTITFGALKNPYFLLSQAITTQVIFNSSYSEYLSWTIPTSMYSPLAISALAMGQSNYGVGNTNVSYTFNLSVPMTPANPQLSVTIPSQVDVGSMTTSLSFYSGIQNTSPYLIGKIVLFPLSVSSTNSSGTIFLSIGGLVNPKSIGSSSSFIILLQLSSLPGGGSCSGCTVAIIDAGLLASSTVPGNIITLSLASSNNSIGQGNNITVYSQLLAAVPAGGKYQLTLPASIIPTQPVWCNNLYGFSLTSGAPACSYNATSHTLYTENFYFSGTGNVVFTTTVINPPDTRLASFSFQTFDAAGNMIGNSSQNSSFSAVPLLLQATASKNDSQVDGRYRLSVNLTLGVALTQNDSIRVILPQAFYSLPSVGCVSSSISIPCNASIDLVSNNLTVSMSPPCSNCNVGSSLSFAIDGLNNPSFINSYSQSIVIQTAHPEGTVEEMVLASALVASSVTISGYNRTGLASVGSPYTLKFNFSIPTYIATNGGQLLITFVPFDSYVAVSYNSGSYSYPVSLGVTDNSGSAYNNTVVYDGSSVPSAVQQIVVSICGGNPCTGSISIVGLNRGYYTLAAMTQTVAITTNAGDSVASSAFSVLQYSPTKATHVLGLALSNSVTTLSSNYILTLVSDKIPISGKVTFGFSSMHKINGGCFGV